MVSLIYRYNTRELNSKAVVCYMMVQAASVVGPLFPDFAEIIRRKLNIPLCHGLAFESCHLIGFLSMVPFQAARMILWS
jgi:hypothetical protein